MRVGQISARPHRFLSVKVDDSELLKLFGVEITTIWTEEITNVVNKLSAGKTGTIGKMVGIELPMGNKIEPTGCIPDLRIKERMDDIASKLDYRQIGGKKLEKIAVIELAVEELARVNKLDCIAFECWAYLAVEFGIQACIILCL